MIRLKVLLDTKPRGWGLKAKAIIMKDCYPDEASFVRQHIAQSGWAGVTYDPDDPLGDKQEAKKQYSLWAVGNNDDK